MKTQLQNTIFLISVIVAFSLTTVQATDYYVSSSGDDDFSGTSLRKAWRSIHRVNQMDFNPGDRILFEANKLFEGQIYLDSADGNDSLSRVIISSYGKGKAIISSGSGYGFYGYNTQGVEISDLIFMGAGMNINTTDGIIFFTDLPGNKKLQNIVLNNIEVMEYGERGISIGSWNETTGYKDVLIDHTEVHHVRRSGIEFYAYFSPYLDGWAHENVDVTNSEVHHIVGYASGSHRGNGIVLGQVSSGRIEHCVAHDNGMENTACGGPGGIWAWDCNKITIQYCESYRNHTQGNCDGLGFDLDGGVQNSVMQYNYSHDNDGAGFLIGQFSYARDWKNNTIRYNISVNDGRKNSAGISVFKAPGTNMKNARIYNNTIIVSPSDINNELAAFNFIEWENEIDSVEVFNNIFQSSGTVPLIDVPSGYEAYFAGNLYWSTDNAVNIKYQGNEYNTLRSWQDNTGNEIFDNEYVGIVSDPKFVDTTDKTDQDQLTVLDQFRLTPGSPAINAGVDPGFTASSMDISVDFWDNPIPQQGYYDIGAYEMSAEEEEDWLNNSANSDILGKAEKNIEGGIVLFPNPAQASSTYVDIQGEAAMRSVELFSFEGGLIWQKYISEEIHSTQIPIEGLSAGLYMVRVISSSDLAYTGRLVIR